MRAPWMTRALPILITGLCCLGCDKKQYQPLVVSAEAAQKAEPEVRNAPADKVLLLSAKELNEFFKNKQEAEWKNRPGQMCRVVAKVKDVSIQKPQERGPTSLRLTLYVPDYAAASVECYFAAEHEDKLRALRAGHEVAVRGTLTRTHHTVRDHVLDLSGCIFEDR